MIDLLQIKHIGIIGLSPFAYKDSYQVSLYLQNKGYIIYPIYPRKQMILHRQAVQRISELEGLPIELFVIFRKSEVCLKLTQEIISLHFPNLQGIWLQLGIKNEEARELAIQNKLKFVQDRCIKIEREKYEN